jgi:hypothetical protein
MAKRWTRAEEDFLATHYRNMSDDALAKRLGVAKRTVTLRLRKLGLERSVEESTGAQDEELTGTRSFIKGGDQKVALRRTSAIEAFDAAARELVRGRSRSATAQLKQVITDYSDVLDVARQARLLLDMVRHPEKYPRVAVGDEEEEPRLRGGEEALCARCGAPLLVSEETVRAWCDACEKYVDILSREEARSRGLVEAGVAETAAAEPSPEKAELKTKKKSGERKGAPRRTKGKARTGAKKKARK